MKKILISLAAISFATQSILAEDMDLQSLRQQLTDLAIQRMPALEAVKDELQTQIMQSLEADAQLKELAQNYIENKTLSPEESIKLTQLIAQMQAAHSNSLQAQVAPATQTNTYKPLQQNQAQKRKKFQKQKQSSTTPTSTTATTTTTTQTQAQNRLKQQYQNMRQHTQNQQQRLYKLEQQIYATTSGAPQARQQNRQMQFNKSEGFNEEDKEKLIQQKQMIKKQIKAQLELTGKQIALPEQELEELASLLVGDSWEVADVEVQKDPETQQEQIKLKARKKVTKKLFGFIPVTITETAEITQGNIKLKRPWWSIFAW